jgi:hypothetical protein
MGHADFRRFRGSRRAAMGRRPLEQALREQGISLPDNEIEKKAVRCPPRE